MHAQGSYLLCLLVAASVASATAALLICAGLALKLRQVARRAYQTCSQLLDELASMRRELALASARVSEQSRRIALLEARARLSGNLPEQDEREAIASLSQPGITERRHRVLSLARRGMDVDTIATTLGELQGEVELMISMASSTNNTEMN